MLSINASQRLNPQNLSTVSFAKKQFHNQDKPVAENKMVMPSLSAMQAYTLVSFKGAEPCNLFNTKDLNSPTNTLPHEILGSIDKNTTSSEAKEAIDKLFNELSLCVEYADNDIALDCMYGIAGLTTLFPEHHDKTAIKIAKLEVEAKESKYPTIENAIDINFRRDLNFIDSSDFNINVYFKLTDETSNDVRQSLSNEMIDNYLDHMYTVTLKNKFSIKDNVKMLCIIGKETNDNRVKAKVAEVLQKVSEQIDVYMNEYWPTILEPALKKAADELAQSVTTATEKHPDLQSLATYSIPVFSNLQQRYEGISHNMRNAQDTIDEYLQS